MIFSCICGEGDFVSSSLELKIKFIKSDFCFHLCSEKLKEKVEHKIFGFMDLYLLLLFLPVCLISLFIFIAVVSMSAAEQLLVIHTSSHFTID